ncbi:MAG: T9SS type A sorting domain-containing protein [Bacteroidia bacterium]
MRTTTKLLSCTLVACMFIMQNAPAQSNREIIVPPHQPGVVYKGANAADPNEVTSQAIQQMTPKQVELTNKVNNLRKADKPSAEFFAAEKELAALNGLRTAPFDPSGNITPMPGFGQPAPSPETIDNIQIHANATFTKGIATATEQRGANVGRVWVSFGVDGNGGVSGDSVKFYYSDDYGITWTYYAYYVVPITDDLGYDDLDIEIIEDTTGDKFIQGVYGYTNGSGSKRIRWMSLNTTTFGGSSNTLSWVGDPANQYYSARIVSDNAHYFGAAYTFIVCSYDSSVANYRSQKIARCVNPYTNTPVFEYRNANIWWFTSASAQPLSTDIAYIRSTTDTLLISFSGVNDSLRIFYIRISEAITAATSSHFYDGTMGPSNWKKNARLAAHGVDNTSVLCVFNELANSNWDVRYFRSLEYGWFDAAHTVGNSQLWGSTVSTNYQPDVVAVRGGLHYYFSFNTINGTTDSINYLTINTQGFESWVQQMNTQLFLSAAQGSKPGFTYKINDSCFVAYANLGPVEVWGASGCIPSPVAVTELASLPGFLLEQNLPNPFSAQTEIRYSLDKADNVSLKIYDAMGKLVTEISNQNMGAGKHAVMLDTRKWNTGFYYCRLSAGSQTAARKMVLVK